MAAILEKFDLPALKVGNQPVVRVALFVGRMIMMGLALSVSYFAFDKFVMDPRRDAENLELATEQAVEQAIAKMEAALPERSIAVLPFVDLSEEGDNEYFSDGIAEELLNLLAKIPELRVISRSSAFSFKGKDFDIPSIASQLKVRHILEGSVRKSGNQVRITAQLIDANTDSHLWSETYDRTMDNIFAIQDEISARVVEQLRITLVGEAPRAEVSPPEAYTAYLQARHLSRQQAQDANESAIELFRKGRGPAPPDGSLDLPSAARFDPGSTDCVADIRPLIRTIRLLETQHPVAVVEEQATEQLMRQVPELRMQERLGVRGATNGMARWQGLYEKPAGQLWQGEQDLQPFFRDAGNR
jgi:TolB-like protein